MKKMILLIGVLLGALIAYSTSKHFFSIDGNVLEKIPHIDGLVKGGIGRYTFPDSTGLDNQFASEITVLNSSISCGYENGQNLLIV